MCRIFWGYLRKSVLNAEISIIGTRKKDFTDLVKSFSIGKFLYLCTLAPAPPMIRSTSFLEAMVVSPGVVIANAPCAAP